MVYTGQPELRLKEILEALGSDFVLFELTSIKELGLNHFSLSFTLGGQAGALIPAPEKAADTLEIQCVWEHKHHILAFAMTAETGIDVAKLKKAAAIVNEINIPGGGWVGKSYISEHPRSRHLRLTHSWDIAVEDSYLLEAVQAPLVAKMLKPNIRRLIIEVTNATTALVQKLSTHH